MTQHCGKNNRGTRKRLTWNLLRNCLSDVAAAKRELFAICRLVISANEVACFNSCALVPADGFVGRNDYIAGSNQSVARRFWWEYEAHSCPRRRENTPNRPIYVLNLFRRDAVASWSKWLIQVVFRRSVVPPNQLSFCGQAIEYHRTMCLSELTK
jgi:hypothetical protein